MKTVLDMLQPGSTPTDEDLEDLHDKLGYINSRDFLLNDLFPRMEREIINHLGAATAVEELWQIKGSYTLLKQMTQLVQSRSETD